MAYKVKPYEQTPKSNKAHQVLGILLLVIGCVVAVAGGMNTSDGALWLGVVLAAAGLLWWAAARVAIWWKQG